MCGTCTVAHGLAKGDIMEGPSRSTMYELAQATLAANKVRLFWWWHSRQ
jgi:uncharacterized protein involved in oxidation of intracellular sulfur